MQSHYFIIIFNFQVSKQSYQLLTSCNASLMPDTSLQWMKENSGCLLLHQESNADPMEKGYPNLQILKPTNSKLAPST